jgi:hypothetical protein
MLVWLAGCQWLVGIEDYSTANGDGGLPDAQSACTPRCESSTQTTCIDGVEEQVECALGCAASGAAECQTFAPSNEVTFGELLLVPSSGDFVAASGETYLLSTDSGEIIATTSGRRVLREATP